MKKIALGLLLSFAVSGAAVAADMAPRYTKAPPMVSPATNWSGFYIGVMGGYASENASDDIGIPGVVADPRMKGGFGGGTLGYNWQTGQFVFGLEADAAFADINASATALGVTVESRIRSLGTVRGRLGVAFDSVLVYATGGYAWADNRFSITAPPLSFSESNFHHGWTAGAGVEWMFAPKWSVKFEYLYRDFGGETYFTGLVPGVAGVDTGNIGFHSGQVGVNYHF
jgi:outer membrane immunogenic protein